MYNICINSAFICQKNKLNYQQHFEIKWAYFKRYRKQSRDIAGYKMSDEVFKGRCRETQNDEDGNDLHFEQPKGKNKGKYWIGNAVRPIVCLECVPEKKRFSVKQLTMSLLIYNNFKANFRIFVWK